MKKELISTVAGRGHLEIILIYLFIKFYIIFILIFN